MSFNILYVENDDKDWEPVALAVEELNGKLVGEKLVIERARTPEELRRKLDLKFDVVLADVYYDDPRAEDGQDIADRIDDIIRFVEEWRFAQPEDRQLPVIAYTAWGEDALRRCLGMKDSLYDIWDKNTAIPEYVAWRLSRLAVEVVRNRPDARMQKLLREMRGGASWHSNVLDMARRYDAGWTERDQVERVGKAIGDIAHKLGVWDQCEPMWKVMLGWEWLGRGASRQMRGHCRHVVNVFWLGYLLIHQHQLGGFFKRAWKNVVAARDGMEAVAEEKPLEALSTSWFYASLFHDVAACLEKAQYLVNRQFELINPLLPETSAIPNIWKAQLEGLRKSLVPIVSDFGAPVDDLLRAAVEDGLGRSAMDHGVLAAAHLRRVIIDHRQSCFAREAARAMALHNLYPTFSSGVAQSITWEREPIVCLLLLCDQLQTWDRERGDESIRDEDRPHRAELAEIEVTNGKKPVVMMRIDYIAPAHVLRSSEVLGRVQDELEEVLKSKPSKALGMVGKPWPFELRVECSLSGRKLDTGINL